MTTDNVISLYPDEFNGYPNYADILNPTLRAWNRLNTVFNIKEILHNNSMAVKYVAQFPKHEQIAIALLAAKVSKDGYENTRRELVRKNNR